MGKGPRRGPSAKTWLGVRQTQTGRVRAQEQVPEFLGTEFSGTALAQNILELQRPIW